MIRRSSYGAEASPSNSRARPSRSKDDHDGAKSTNDQGEGSMDSMVTVTSEDSTDLMVTVTSEAEEGWVSSPSRTASVPDVMNSSTEKRERSTPSKTTESYAPNSSTTLPLAPSPARTRGDSEGVEIVEERRDGIKKSVSQQPTLLASELAPAVAKVAEKQTDSLAHESPGDRKVILAPEVCYLANDR